jgi:MFS family permease
MLFPLLLEAYCKSLNFHYVRGQLLMLNSAPFVSDFLQEHFLGRRGAIAIACAVSIGATIGQCFSTSIAQIIGCRVVTGLTLAAKASSAPLLTAEVAPNHLRGKCFSL